MNTVPILRGTLPALVVALAFVPAWAPARAQNLLAGADFDSPSDLDSWAVNTGGIVQGADSGSCATSGSIDAASGLSGGGDQTFWMTSLQCILVDPVATPQLLLAGMYRTTADVYARIYLQYFSDTTCSTLAATPWSSPVFGGTAATWNRVAGEVPIDSDVAAVRVHVDTIPAVSGAPAFTIQFDRFYLGVEPQIFLDDFEFESGSACHWSNVVGGT